MSGGLTAYTAFINWLFSFGGIKVPDEFHARCNAINKLVDNDVSGIANTVLGYGINAASEAKYKIECSDKTLQELLNIWLEKVNLEIPGVPTGLQELSKEYFKERWLGSSFCVLRMKNWEKITVGQTSIIVPTTMWFVNGSSIYVKRPKTKNYKLGTDKYFLDEDYKNEIPASVKEEIIIQKPYNRWFDEYATPYLIRTGIYKNWLGMKTLQEKTDEIVTKVLPYLFLIKENAVGNEPVGDPELQKIFNAFKKQIEEYRSRQGQLPTDTIPGNRDYSHLIPDLRNAVSEELFRQGTRTILAGLGFVDLLEISPSRQESRMNPKPFIAEVNAGVGGFKSILLDAIYMIIERNKVAHKKMFSDNNKIMVVNSPLKINVEQILSDLRSGYDRGVSSIQTYQEILGLDPQTEKERREKELKDGDEDLYYPHLIQNREDVPDRLYPAKPRNERNENQNKKRGTPESKNFKAEIEEAEAKYFRFRQREPSEFDEKTFRIITLSKTQGIKAVIGRLKGEKTTTIQSYLFDKEKWTEEEAKKWVKDHDGKVEAALEYIIANLEDLEIAPYKSLEEVLRKHPELKKYPEKAQRLWMEVFNSIYKDTGDEGRAFAGAWSKLRKWMKRHSKGGKNNE